MKKTSFIMPANDVSAESSVTEKSYNIAFVGNLHNFSFMYYDKT